MIRIATFLVTTTIAAIGCSIPYTCDPARDLPDGGEPYPNPGRNGLPAVCEPFGGLCNPNRCAPYEHMTAAPACDCVPDYKHDAGAPI